MISLDGAPAAVSVYPDTAVMTAHVTGIVPTDKITYHDGTLIITDPRGATVYAHTPRYRGRGNSTWAAPKKPFKVRSLDRLQTPFGFAPSRDWAFMADYYDPACIRSSLGFEIYRRATGRWAPHSRHIWLDWAAGPKGLYRYSETTDLQVGRVDFRAMEDTDITGNALTGPYYLETDEAFDSPGFRTSLQTPTMYDSPEVLGIPAQEAYISSWTEAAETALITGTAAEIAAHFDLDSWVDWYLLMEFVRNDDASWFKSCKWVKDQDSPNGVGKAVAVAPWDLDLTIGIKWNASTSPTGWDVRLNPYVDQEGGRPNWMYYLWNRWPDFRDACQSRWTSSFAPTIAGIEGFHARWSEAIEPLIIADRAIWHGGVPLDGANQFSGIQQWMEDRLAWITANL